MLTTPARRAAVHALVAGGVPDHDAAALVAGRCVCRGLEREAGGFDAAGTGDDFLLGDGDGGDGVGVAADHADGLLLLGTEELRAEPLEDVIHQGLGHGDLGVTGEAGGLEAHVGELVHEGL